MKERLSVAVGMSGGVDSSVAAALLKQAGCRVTGVSMKLWDGPVAETTGRHGCYGPGEAQDIEDARQVAALLGISFVVVDVAAEYRTEVLDRCRSEYLSGRTPNPCSICNPGVKFGALLRKVRERGIEFDRFATGHYARVERRKEDGRYLLKKSKHASKDQSYFLAFLSQEQLAEAIFPLGERSKEEVRVLAAEYGLPVAAKPDSQDFVDHGIDVAPDANGPGPVLDSWGRELGRHSGIARHTVGQRRGLGVTGKRPLYVTRIDAAMNAIIVGERYETYSDSLVASHLNWIAVERPEGPMDVTARIRHRHEDARACVRPLGEDEVHVRFEKPQMAVAPGQTVVFYDGDTVVGAGIIDRTRE